MGEITNIVPIQPDPEFTQTDSGEEVDNGTNIVASTEDSGEEYCKRLAADAINFLEEEFRNQITCQDVFWGLIHEESAKKITKISPKTTVEPYSDDVAKSFLEESVPWGKYSGQKILTVLQKDKEALEMLANQPLLFQVRLRRLLACNTSKLIRAAKSNPRKKRK